MDKETILEKTRYFLGQMGKRRQYSPDKYEPQQPTEVQEQLALYRIRGYKAEVDQQSSTSNTTKSLDWYFDPELCKRPFYDYYQRLVLRDDGSYLDWDSYRSIRATHKEDQEYFQYCEVLANETKWFEDQLAHMTHEWSRIEGALYLQAVKIAEEFYCITRKLFSSAFRERKLTAMSYNKSYRGLDDLYLEIWKRVARQQMDFRTALLDLPMEDMLPFRRLDIERELDDRIGFR
ncbi:hypothetical protein ACP4OV_022938 [Aristida adscensionis]